MGMIKIVIVVFVILVLLYLIIQAFSKSNNLTTMADGKALQTITADSLKNTNNSSNFTYSMWFYVDDWNYMFGNTKTVLSRNGGPDVLLGKEPNTLTVNVAYFSTGENAGVVPAGPNTSDCTKNAANATACQACNNGFSCACANCDPVLYAATYDTSVTPPKIKTLTPPCTTGSGNPPGTAGKGRATGPMSSCMIDNVPIQSWVNIIISLYGSTLDTYLNGKLVRTCVLPGVPNIDNTSDILVSPYGGFSGWTSKFQYWPNATNPQQAYNIYKDGFGGSILGNLLNKYRLQFSLIQDNATVGSFQL